jgi:hypothetical protein
VIESSAQAYIRCRRGSRSRSSDRSRARSPGVRFIIADASTYGNVPDPQRAFAEASFELTGSLNTPRVHAIFASAYLALGNQLAAAAELRTDIELVTTQLAQTAPLITGATLTLPWSCGAAAKFPFLPRPGRGSRSWSSRDSYDTILVLLAPDGPPVLGSHHYRQYFAGFQWWPWQRALIGFGLRHSSASTRVS